ncbi:hypothetical protein FNU76_01690 [Chitinimonas arctica]|uniref:Uncharacterized protein n=1 Tax=Chitinimonas arctica TaxID=2594795 RepID=A0A516SAJ7_9NEIS|nr:hypothetical protein FNU76_01690 [Chitinimonas arctica]
MYSTPAHINDDMLPTDHCELLKHALYPLAHEYGITYIQDKFEKALQDMCTDALGVFCAHQCFYIEMINERENSSPFKFELDWLPKYLATSFLREASALHALEIRSGDLLNNRSYKVVLSGMRILASDYGIDWQVTLP